jgi:hypothetical protein
MEEEDAAPVVRILHAPPLHIPACTSLHHNSPGTVVARQSSVQAARAAAVTLDDDEDDQEPVFDLTEEEDPGGIIASAMGSDDQRPVVVNEPMLKPAGGDDQPMQVDKPVKSEVVDLTQTQADDPGGVMLEPLAPLDPMNPNQPDNILRQQPGGEDQPMDEEDDPGNIIRNIVHGGDEQPMDADETPPEQPEPHVGCREI